MRGLDVDVAVELPLVDGGEDLLVLLDRRLRFFTLGHELAEYADGGHETIGVHSGDGLRHLVDGLACEIRTRKVANHGFWDKGKGSGD